MKEYYYYIGYKNDIRRTKYHHTSNFADNQVTMTRKEIGNCFDTIEEAEKAVEKLKAWKRLKDKGFRFDGYDSGHNSNKELCGQAYFKAGNFWFDIKQDLDLLFGSEE